MSRSLRGVAAIVLACASVPFFGTGTAHADTAVLVPTNSGYFYSAGFDKPEQSPATVPNVTAATADGVGEGHLAVAAAGGQEDKVSFLYFDMFSLPLGASVTKAVVTMKLVPLSQDDVSAQASPDLVAACKAGDGGFNGDDGANLMNAPPRLCPDFSVKATAVGTTAYAWDITALAQEWTTGANDGLAFTRVDESPNSSFQVVFDAAPTASLALEYTLPAPEVPVEEPSVDSPPVVDGGTGGSPGGFVPSPDLGAPVEPVVPNPTLNEPPAPVPDTAAPPTQNVAASASMRPTTAFWLALAALGIGIALLSLVLGDPRVPTAARSRSRLSLALDARERLRTSAPLRSHPA